jgi:hypothetical protein
LSAMFFSLWESSSPAILCSNWRECRWR